MKSPIVTEFAHGARARPALVAAALLLIASAASATTLSGTIDTSSAFSPTNQSADGITYYNAPYDGPFPSAAFAIGAFDFVIPTGFAASGATISGNFGSDILGSSTSEVDLFLNQVEVARCDSACAAASESADVAWSHVFSAAELGALASGSAVLTAVQQGPSQVVLDPTSIAIDVTAAVPEPGTALMMIGGVLPLLAMGLRRRRSSASTASPRT